MIHPSYTELIEAINRGGEEGEADMVLNSRYSLVLATSKRARQLIAGAKPLVKGASGKKPLSVAIEELYQGKVKILPPKEEEDVPVIDDITSNNGYKTTYYDSTLVDDDETGEGYPDGDDEDDEDDEDGYSSYDDKDDDDAMDSPYLDDEEDE